MSNARLAMGLERYHARKSTGLGIHEERFAETGEAVFIAVDLRGKMRGVGRNAGD